MGMGLRFEQGTLALQQWDLCSGTMGFSQNSGWEMVIASPPSGPSRKQHLFSVSGQRVHRRARHG